MGVFKKISPTYRASSIFEIDYDSIKNDGINTLLFDIDNTLASYSEILPSSDVITLIESLKEKGFKIILISNNSFSRVKYFVNTLKCKAYSRLCKPFSFKVLKIFKKEDLDKNKTIIIGDQIMTDIRLSLKVGVKSVLVNPIDKDSEKWFTKINRRREKRWMN